MDSTRSQPFSEHTFACEPFNKYNTTRQIRSVEGAEGRQPIQELLGAFGTLVRSAASNFCTGQLQSSCLLAIWQANPKSGPRKLVRLIRAKIQIKVQTILEMVRNSFKTA